MAQRKPTAREIRRCIEENYNCNWSSNDSGSDDDMYISSENEVVYIVDNASSCEEFDAQKVQ